MSEIERAIKVLEEEYAFALECDDTQKRSSALHATLAVLRAELEREKNPLTCDGCGYVGYSICEDCIRNKKVKKDYYKEKMCDRYFEEDGGQCWSCCCWNEDKKDYKIFVTCKGDKTKCCR